MALKTPEEEIAELRQANDELYREHANEKAQMQAANGQWRESYAALDEAKRYAEEQIEETRRYAEEQFAAEKAELEEQIAQLEESVKNCTAGAASRLGRIARTATGRTPRQLDERDDRFAQLSAEYDTLRAQYDAQKTHEDALAAKQQDLTSSGNKVEDLQTQVASLESQLKAASADEDVREANQSALLQKQEQLDEVNARVKGLEDELALLSLTGPGGNDYTARIRGLQQEVFVKSEQLVQQGEKHLRVAGLFDKTKSELVQLREEVGNVRRVLLRGIGLDSTITSQDTGMDDSLYQHVKLEELRTERLESELDSAQAGLRDLQSMREKMVEMVGRERVEKELRAKSEQTNKELGEKVAALSEHVEKLMVHLKHEAAAKARAVEAQRRVDKELLETRDKLASATRKNAAQDAKVAELEQGARILEDQLRLMDEKFIDVRNKLDWTRSSARKENKQLSAELHGKRRWGSEWVTRLGATTSVPKFSKKAPLGTSSSESRLPTPKASNNGLSPVVAAVVQDALAIGNGARVKFDIPKLPQPESDAGTPWSDAKLLLVTVAVLLPPNSALSSPRDRGPLFNGSVVVRSLDSVWVVDYYSSWCAHCRMFAPKWEKVGEFYHESKVVQVGAVDCNQHKDVCQREEVHAYPSVKAHHVNMEVRGRKKAKPVVEWVEKLLAEHGIESGMDISTIVEETKLRRNDVDEEGGVLNDDTSIQMKYKRLRDAGKAAMLALENSFFIGTPVLEGERYAAALKWVNALADTFQWKGTWNELIEKWRPTARETSFSSDLFDSRGDEDSEWAVCETYTCGLWSLFHSMTTRDIKSGNAVEAWKPSDTECRQHFMEANPESLVEELAASDSYGPHAVVVWAWKMHNSVNKRLHRDQWPSTSSCPSCYIDIGGPVSIGMSLIHEDGMVTYVTSVYGHEDEALFDEIIMAVHGSHIYVPSGFFSAITGVTLFFALLAVVLKTQRHRFVTSKESGHMA
ncbi:Thioredoxin, conserved site [Phytophthora cactorum]|nr:Thioredoxin, conserved site [Phytophthora cactorum]